MSCDAEHVAQCSTGLVVHMVCTHDLFELDFSSVV